MRLPIYLRYISKKLFLTFTCTHLAVLLCFFSLEFLTLSQIPAKEKLFMHFLSLSLTKADLLLPLSFILSSLILIENFKHSNEWIAFETSGVSRAKLFKPFFLLALLLTLFSFWNVEFGVQKSTQWKMKSSKIRKLKSLPPFEIRYLNDQTKILFQQNESAIFDLFWIKNHKEIIHAKNVKFENHQWQGEYVDVLKQNPVGRYEKTESFETLPFPFEIKNVKRKSLNFYKMPISKNLKYLLNKNLNISEDYALLATCFFSKLISPFIFLTIATFIVSIFFRKSFLSTYLIFAIAIFAYLIFYSMQKTFIIMGENYIIPPLVAALTLPFIAQCGFTYLLMKK
jgi:lipopolysaccharide export LptBFGC system permease protein LptF